MKHARGIDIDLTAQVLTLRPGDRQTLRYPVSTAANGPGELEGSECTPRGQHEICAKFGAGCAFNTVFVGREPTGEIYTTALRAAQPGRDWILTRVLWLSGKEPGKNLGGDVDTRSRYIYVHGCPDDVDFAHPGSRGCIRMRNHDVVELFERVPVGTEVCIHE